MPDADQYDDDRERDLDAVIAEYYRLLDADEPPDQNAFILRYPDFALELREFFSDAQLLQGPDYSNPQDNHSGPSITSDNISRPAKSASRPVVRYFGEYEILEELGVGGMGVVYQARQTKLNKIIALKMIKVGHLAGDDEVRRFRAEARAAAKLDHPGIVPVHEVGVDHGQHYYTMDYVGGGSLSKLHRDEPVAARRAAEIIKQMAEAMHYAHGQGIVHRDLKPANVLLTAGGVPRITDFGLAKRLWTEDDSVGVSMTETGQILGTAGYMSPEQAAGKSRLVGPPADIYALGAVLYALLTGRAPFVGESQADTILQVIQRDPVSPRVLNPSVARDLETICLKCLEKEPHRRYGTAQLLADDLCRFLDGRPVTARPISPAARGWRWCRRNPSLAVLGMVILLVAGVSPFVAAGMYHLAEERETARKDATDNSGKLEISLTAERKATYQATEALSKERKAKSELAKALQDKELALTESQRRARQIARRNYVLLLSQAPELWRQARLADLKALLSEASSELIDQSEFGLAYWTARLQETVPLATLPLPARQHFSFSQDSRRAACVQTLPDDLSNPANVYKRQVVELYRVISDSTGSPPVRFEHQRRLTLPFAAHNPKIAFLPDNKRLAVTAGDGPEVHLIDLDTDEKSLAFKTRYSMYGISYFSTGGSHLLKYDGDDERWEFWSVQDGTRQLLPKRDDFNQQAELVLSDDGTLVGSKDGVVIKVEGGEQVAELPGRITQFSPNNRFVVASSSVWQLTDGKEVIKFPDAGQCAFSRTNPDIAFALCQGVLLRLDLGRAQSTRLGMIGPAGNLALIPGDEKLVLGTLPDAIAAWSNSRPSATSSLRLGQIAAISGNRRYVVARGKAVNAYEVWDLFERKKLADVGEHNTLPAQFKLYSFGVSDDALVAYTFDLLEVTLFDSRNNKVLDTWKPKTITATGALKRASITPDGKTVLLGEAGALHGWDHRTRKGWTMTSNSAARFDGRFNISPDSHWVSSGGALWSLANRTKDDLPASVAASTSLNDPWVALNGETLLAGPLGTFFNPTRRELHSFITPEHSFRGIAVSPDSRNLAVVNFLLGPPSLVRVFAIAEDEKPARLWPVLELELEGFSAYQCAFTPDSRTLILIDQGGVVNYIHANLASVSR